jgi:hypothetical protein
MRITGFRARSEPVWEQYGEWLIRLAPVGALCADCVYAHRAALERGALPTAPRPAIYEIARPGQAPLPLCKPHWAAPEAQR